MMKRRALMVASPASTVFASLNRAAPAMTRTPSPAKRSAETCGATACIAWRTCAMTAAKSMPERTVFTPNRAPERTALACSAAASSAFDGTDAALEALAAHAAFFDRARPIRPWRQRPPRRRALPRRRRSRRCPVPCSLFVAPSAGRTHHNCLETRDKYFIDGRKAGVSEVSITSHTYSIHFHHL